MGRSRSNTPVPMLRTTPLLRSGIDSPKYPMSGQAISARRLAATLWEMSETPSPKMSNLEVIKQQQHKNGSRMGFKGDNHSGSGSLPHQLLDPPHILTVSEEESSQIERSGKRRIERKRETLSWRI